MAGGSGGWGALVAGTSTSAAGFSVNQGLFDQLGVRGSSGELYPALSSSALSLEKQPCLFFCMVGAALSVLASFPLPWYQEIP